MYLSLLKNGPAVLGLGAAWALLLPGPGPEAFRAADKSASSFSGVVTTRRSKRGFLDRVCINPEEEVKGATGCSAGACHGTGWHCRTGISWQLAVGSWQLRGDSSKHLSGARAACALPLAEK